MENASYSRVRLETAPYSSKLGIGEFCFALAKFRKTNYVPHLERLPRVGGTLTHCKVPSSPLSSPVYLPVAADPRLLPFAFCCSSGILSAVYVLGLLACLVLGSVLGPDVFDRSPPAAVETTSLNVTWSGVISGMERWHQVRERKTMAKSIS